MEKRKISSFINRDNRNIWIIKKKTSIFFANIIWKNRFLSKYFFYSIFVYSKDTKQVIKSKWIELIFLSTFWMKTRIKLGLALWQICTSPLHLKESNFLQTKHLLQGTLNSSWKWSKENLPRIFFLYLLNWRFMWNSQCYSNSQ